jgi:hypothetical protein
MWHKCFAFGKQTRQTDVRGFLARHPAAHCRAGGASGAHGLQRRQTHGRRARRRRLWRDACTHNAAPPDHARRGRLHGPHGAPMQRLRPPRCARPLSPPFGQGGRSGCDALTTLDLRQRRCIASLSPPSGGRAALRAGRGCTARGTSGALTTLWCDGCNALTALDLLGCTALTWLHCAHALRKRALS